MVESEASSKKSSQGILELELSTDLPMFLPLESFHEHYSKGRDSLSH